VNSSRFWAPVILAIAVCLPLIGCGNYPKISPRAFELAKLLDNACDARQPRQLENFRAMVDQSREADDITDAEKSWLLDITAIAESGQWESAAEEIRQMLLDQNRPAS